MWDVVVFLTFVFVVVMTMLSTVVTLFSPNMVRETYDSLSRKTDAQLIRRVLWSIPLIILLLEFWQVMYS